MMKSLFGLLFAGGVATLMAILIYIICYAQGNRRSYGKSFKNIRRN